MKKPLAKAPRHMQNLLLQVQYYSYSLENRAGKDIPVADTLSRAPLQDKQNIGNKIFHFFFTSLSRDRLKQVWAATSADAECVELKNTILTGWPQSKQEVPRAITPYFDYRDELTVQDGIILKGERIVIPWAMWKEVTERAHSGHMPAPSLSAGILARDVI